jgi:TPR repeat protein
LNEVHQSGFIHRDIRPANLYLRDDMTPVLLDFGSARQTSAGDHALTVLVAPGYAPLEQYGSCGKRQGPWTDIYGLGATLYRAITGAPPLDSLERYNGVSGLNEDQLRPAREIGAGRYSASLLRAIDHALTLKIKQRPQSIEDWLKDFREPGRPGIILAASTTRKTPALMDSTKVTGPTSHGLRIRPLAEVMTHCRRALATPFARGAGLSGRGVWFDATVLSLTLGLGLGAWHVLRHPTDAVKPEEPSIAQNTPAPANDQQAIQLNAQRAAEAKRLDEVRAELGLAEARREDARRQLAELENLRGLMDNQQQQMKAQLAHLDELRRETAALKARQEAAARDHLAALAEPIRYTPRKTPAARIEAERPAVDDAADEKDAENAALKQQAAEESRRLEALRTQRAEQERELDRLRTEMAKLAAAAHAQERKPPIAAEPARPAPAPVSLEALAEAVRTKTANAAAVQTRTDRAVTTKPTAEAAATASVANTRNPPTAPAPEPARVAKHDNNTAASTPAVPRNPAEAARFYRHAAEQGDAQAQLELARLYAKGQGVPKDEFFAYVWYAVAAHAGNPAAEAERKYLARTLQPVQLKQAQPLVESILAKYKITVPAPATVSYAHSR